MRPPSSARGAVLVLILALAGAVAPGDWVDTPPAPHPLLEHRRFASPALKADAGFQVYRPPDYATAPERRYPVVYWLHDRDGSEARPALDPRTVDDAIRAGILPPLLVVYPHVPPGSFYVDAPDSRLPAETVLVKELVPHIDRTFRTQAERDGRALQGVGRGGFGAVRLAFRHPGLFGSVVAYAGEFPSVDDLTRKPEYEEAFRESFGGDFLRAATLHPAVHARAHADALRGHLGLRLVSGPDPAALESTREFLRSLWPARLTVDPLERRAPVDTAEALVRAEGLAGLEFAAARFPQARSPDRDGPWTNPPTNRLPRVEHHVFYSRSLERPVGYHLYLPPGHQDRSGAAPVLPLLLHLPAWGEDESRHLDVIGYLDAAIRFGGVPPHAWVWACSGRTSWYTDTADGRVPAETVVLRELLPHVEARWRLGGGPERRAVDGWGMGAYGALRLATAHPGTFQAALLHNPTLPDAAAFESRYPDAWISLFGSETANFLRSDPWTALTRNREALRDSGFRIRTVVGERSGRRDDARRLRDRLAALGLAHEYEELPGESGPRPGWHAVSGLRDLQFMGRVEPVR